MAREPPGHMDGSVDVLAQGWLSGRLDAAGASGVALVLALRLLPHGLLATPAPAFLAPRRTILHSLHPLFFHSYLSFLSFIINA